MMSNGFKINECDKCVYIKNTNEGYIIVCLYVDDMFIIDSNNVMIKNTMKILNKHFDMKDLGLADVILGMKITKTSEGYALSQSHDIEKNLANSAKMMIILLDHLWMLFCFFLRINMIAFFN